MVEYQDILKAVNLKIKNKFPEIKILSESDVAEKIIRPSFMVKIDNASTSNFMFDTADETLTVIIYYFASDKDKNKLENLDMIKQLKRLFLRNNQIEIIQETGESFYVGVEETESEIVDKVLNFSFDLEFSQDWEQEENDIELMEDLEYKEEINV